MSPHDELALLDALAAEAGIAPDYHDNWGRHHIVSAETKRAILNAMGLRTDGPEALQTGLITLVDSRWSTPCDPVLVVRSEQARLWSFRMAVPQGEDSAVRVRWELRDEFGAVLQNGSSDSTLAAAETRSVGGQRYVRVELPVPSGLSVGYYDLFAWGTSPTTTVEGALRLIVAPNTCYLPPSFAEQKRAWGVAVQLYTMRSSRNWGVGDFTDLGHLVEWAAEDLGADLVGISPLHALRNERPHHISPYNPTSRLYLNMLYVDVEKVPDLQDSVAGQRLTKDKQFRRELGRLRAADLVDYDAVAAAKVKTLEAAFADFETRHLLSRAEGLSARTVRGKAFLQFIQEEGEALEQFALFQALSEELHRRDASCCLWQDWPEAYQCPSDPAVIRFRESNPSRVRFHQYLQWIAHEQLESVAEQARRLGMEIGLYHDLALGSDRGGSDAWMFRDVLALGADCGCPPDAFALEGQNWGLPPVIPWRLQATGYRMFIAMVRKGLRYGGALRLDHVMGLFRLFWIPRGLPASAGAYVQYPWEDLLAILALESERHQAVIVGEDLGTVPDWIREKLGTAGVLSYRVLYFERGGDGAWKRPQDYPRQSVAVVTTHDLPTLAGYWQGADLELRTQLGLYPDEGVRRRAWEERTADKYKLLAALREAGVLQEAPSDDQLAQAEMGPALLLAIHTFLARSASSIVAVNVEDLAGESVQVNVPGTVERYPNWSRKLGLSISKLRRHRGIRQLARAIGSVRGD